MTVEDLFPNLPLRVVGQLNELDVRFSRDVQTLFHHGTRIKSLGQDKTSKKIIKIAQILVDWLTGVVSPKFHDDLFGIFQQTKVVDTAFEIDLLRQVKTSITDSIALNHKATVKILLSFVLSLTKPNGPYRWSRPFILHHFTGDLTK